MSVASLVGHSDGRAHLTLAFGSLTIGLLLVSLPPFIPPSLLCCR
jgi:hypothetical protein